MCGPALEVCEWIPDDIGGGACPPKCLWMPGPYRLRGASSGSTTQKSRSLSGPANRRAPPTRTDRFSTDGSTRSAGGISWIAASFFNSSFIADPISSPRLSQFECFRRHGWPSHHEVCCTSPPTSAQALRPARGTTSSPDRAQAGEEVSIHAPRAGRDSPGDPTEMRCSCFNPRAPRGARRPLRPELSLILMFQSTRPARGATSCHASLAIAVRCFNPRAPRGARHGLQARSYCRERFNPRAPRGARRYSIATVASALTFQSTRPRGARPIGITCFGTMHAFQSTRPARGATIVSACDVPVLLMFQSTRPRGARRPRCERDTTRCEFQSTRPARGATRCTR